MANLTTILEKQNSLEAMLIKRCAEFEALYNSKSTTDDDISLHKLHTEFTLFKEQMFDIIQLLRLQITEICKSLDSHEMLHRREYLLISGIPENTAEELDVVVSTIIHNNFGIQEVPKAAFRSLVRLGKKPQAEGKARLVLIRFADMSLKSMIWKKKTCLKGSPYVLSEFLTRRRQNLFVNARKTFGFKNCWTRDGNIMVKTASGDLRRVESDDDLEKLGQLIKSCQATQVPAPATVEIPKQKRSARSRK